MEQLRKPEPVSDGLLSPSAPWGWVLNKEKVVFRVAERVRRRGGAKRVLTLSRLLLFSVCRCIVDDEAVSRPMRDGARARPRGACLGEKPVAEMATEIYLSVSYGRLYCA